MKTAAFFVFKFSIFFDQFSIVEYLRYALYNSAKLVCQWDPTFRAYLAKKRAEGKHYNVAISHAAKKLVRLIFALQKSGQSYIAKT